MSTHPRCRSTAVKLRSDSEAGIEEAPEAAVHRAWVVVQSALVVAVMDR